MSRRTSTNELVVFLGPSLRADEARKLVPCEVLPPARQGDIWRVLPRRPKAIALIDGVFESTPSVWHHELLTALASGVAVFGASSMGALRAAELYTQGMIGVGSIFADYRDGRRVDDSDVALLHGDEENQFVPMTVPLVNVEHAATLARKARVLTPKQAASVVRVASRMFYQDRTWPALVRAMGWTAALEEKFRSWVRETQPDLKADDARLCLTTAAEFVRRGGPAPLLEIPRTGALGSSLVRRRRLWSDGGVRLQSLRALPEAADLVAAGQRRALLAGLARTRGLVANQEDLNAEREALRKRAPLLADAELAALAEDVVLERLMVENASRVLPDAPSDDEALMAEAAVRGLLRRD